MNCGTLATYKRGCRCTKCRKANADYQHRYRKHAYLKKQLLVDAEPVRRKIRALHAIGWTQRQLSTMCGHATQLLTQPKVRQQVAENIDRLYQQLSGRPGQSKAARRIAARKGWPPPLAWDNIETGDLAEEAIRKEDK